jgi:flagellar motility protein MotE (MotC chaperone)
MEAKKAAIVFEKIDKDLVVALFNRFPQKQTTQILALMNPDRSVELSEYYGRIKSAKEYELLKEINVALRGQFEECKGLPKAIP